jgi:DNA polymerase III sliding clamp (beta) subunit (PCNA family)
MAPVATETPPVEQAEAGLAQLTTAPYGDVCSETIKARVIEGKFPDYEQIIPDRDNEQHGTIAINARYLLAVARYISAHCKSSGDEPHVAIELYGPEKPLIFSAKTPEGQKVRALIMPLRVENIDRILN